MRSDEYKEHGLGSSGFTAPAQFLLLPGLDSNSQIPTHALQSLAF